MIGLRRVWAVLAMGMALASLPYLAYGDGQSSSQTRDPEGSDWLATGTVTKVDGSIFRMLGQDNQVYTVQAAKGQLITNDADGSKYAPAVGDNVKVFGIVSGDGRIEASRVNLMGKPIVPPAPAAAPAPASAGAGPRPKQEIRIVIEKEPTQTAPNGSEQPQTAVACPPDWEGRGLIMDIDYTAHTLKVRTSSGQFTVAVTGAQLVRGAKRIGFGLLNMGDAVFVSGNMTGSNQIDAQIVRVTRTRDEAQGSVAQNPVSVVGVVTNVDVPSQTFTMRTSGPSLVVLVDRDSVIQNQMDPVPFDYLKPGMRVKMSGYGNMGNGYVAQHIQVISLAP